MGGICLLTALFLFICGFPSHLLRPFGVSLLLQLAAVPMSSLLLTSPGPETLSCWLLFLCRYKLALLKRFPGRALTPSGAQPHKHRRYLSNEREAVKLQGNLSDLSETARRNKHGGAETDVPKCHPTCFPPPRLRQKPCKPQPAP